MKARKGAEKDGGGCMVHTLDLQLSCNSFLMGN